MNTQFNLKMFGLSYAGLAILLALILLPAFDIAGSGLLLIGMAFPVPFFLMGYYAHKIKWTLLYALIVMIIGAVIMLIGFPLLLDVFKP